MKGSEFTKFLTSTMLNLTGVAFLTVIFISIVLFFPNTSSVSTAQQEVPMTTPISVKTKAAEEKGVTLPELVTLQAGRLATVEAQSEGKIIRWINPNLQVDLIPSESGRWAIIAAPTPGKYPIFAYTAINGEPTKAARCYVVVSTTPPVPPGPTPPTPPGPTPPTPPTPPEPTPPGPTPDPAPIPVAGFRVLIVYDTNKADAPALFAKKIRDYLEANCVKGPGGQPEWRIWPSDIDTSNESPTWKNAFARQRKSLPWLVVSNGQTGFEGPLPAKTDDTLKILKDYKGE